MKVLLALDQSGHSQTSAKFLKDFPLPPESSVVLLLVAETPQLTMLSEVYDIADLEQRLATSRVNLRTKAQQFLTKIKGLVHRPDLTVTSEIRDGLPGAEILKCIETEHIDLVVMGTRGLSRVKTFFLGSVSEWVLSDAPCSVLLVRERTGRRARKQKGLVVLLAMDGSPDARAAIELLRKLPFPPSSSLALVHVVEQNYEHVASRELSATRGELARIGKDLLRLRKESGAKMLGEIGHEFRQRGWEVSESLLIGHPADQILKACEETRPDLVVVGSRGLTGLRRFLLGSVSHKVTRRAPSSVLVVRRPDEETTAGRGE